MSNYNFLIDILLFWFCSKNKRLLDRWNKNKKPGNIFQQIKIICVKFIDSRLILYPSILVKTTTTTTTNHKIHSIMCLKSREWWKCFWRSIIEIYMSLVTEWERKTIRTTDVEEEDAIDEESYLCQGPAEHGNEWKIGKSNLSKRESVVLCSFYMTFRTRLLP